MDNQKSTKPNVVHSFTLKEDGTFAENKATRATDKAEELVKKFGDKAIDVAIEVIGAIEHEDNTMYYEIKFWKEVRDEILLFGTNKKSE